LALWHLTLPLAQWHLDARTWDSAPSARIRQFRKDCKDIWIPKIKSIPSLWKGLRGEVFTADLGMSDAEADEARDESGDGKLAMQNRRLPEGGQQRQGSL